MMSNNHATADVLLHKMPPCCAARNRADIGILL
jgi:hypothetical protein